MAFVKKRAAALLLAFSLLIIKVKADIGFEPSPLPERQKPKKRLARFSDFDPYEG